MTSARIQAYILTLCGILIASNAHAQETTWITGSNVQGHRGLYLLNAAHSITPGGLVLTLRASYSIASGVLRPGDQESSQSESLALVWSPLQGLELGYNQTFQVNLNTAYPGGATNSLGDPSVGAKYSWDIDPSWAIGGRLALSVPSSSEGQGLSFNAGSVGIWALGTYQPIAPLEISANLGFVFDARNNLKHQGLNDAQLFAIDLPASNYGALGLGLAARLAVSPALGLFPFGEVTAMLAPHAPFAKDVILGTLGLRIAHPTASTVELAAGVNLRISGAPRDNTYFAGAMPWTAFLLAGLHVGDAPPPAAPAAAGAAAAAPPPIAAPVAACPACPTPPQTFSLAGRVIDRETGEGLVTSSVSVIEHSPKMPVQRDGAFVSEPIAVSAGAVELRAEAPGYAPASQLVPRSADAAKALVFKLVKEDARSELRGSITGSVTGNPIAGASIALPQLKVHDRTDAQGAFTLLVAPGTYQVFISAKGYTTQIKRLTIEPGDVVIFNASLQPGKRHGPRGQR